MLEVPSMRTFPLLGTNLTFWAEMAVEEAGAAVDTA